LTLAWFCYKKGVKNEIIESMIGHSENSRAFVRYHGIVQEVIPFLQTLYFLLEMANITNQNLYPSLLIRLFYFINLNYFQKFKEIIN
jgi:hypothetical protein